ncbi:MAG TPA: DEAD/DEAH box helicase [Methanothermococcus okinawensis]|uniref:ATP-dependent DNA helicase Hel308 n=1 Tax=Methanothermococcus okinawensis TaxID=155863 RepID=A0A833DS79_9EURY|nr:DEAD/DEAH box helicase [Methanothermococcus okinawensis]
MSNRIWKILKENGIKELRPPQKKVVDRGLLNKNKNFLIHMSTGSGKTLIGEIAILNHLLDQKYKSKKALFIVPLKALASEKYEEFIKKYEKYGIKVALSIGDFDEEEDLENYDLIITTAEKLESLLRHRVEWIEDVSILVIDEIHLIGDSERGGTLEILLTKLKNRYNIQIIGLSATIGNPEEFAKWLNAELVIEDWRPVKLKKGIAYKNRILFINEDGDVVEEYTLTPNNYNSRNQLFNLVVDCILKDGSLLIFCNSKRKAVSESKKLNLKKYLSPDELNELKKLKEDILSVFDNPTETCKTLGECIERGVAFHHAGLTYEQRKIVEEGFRKKLIKVICCTPTLSMGMNTPCRRVILRDLKRFSNRGMVPIPKMEVLQCIGRAGRPNLDPYGEGIIYIDGSITVEDAKNYLTGPVENIYSKLSNHRILRAHILGLIASGEIDNKKNLEEFINNTFYAHQYGNTSKILKNINDIIEFLEANKFIKIDYKDDNKNKNDIKILTLDENNNITISHKKTNENYTITSLGKRISELYIDPLSGKIIIEELKKLSKKLERYNNKYLNTSDLKDYCTQYLLYSISKTTEMMPLLRVRNNEWDYLFKEMLKMDIDPDEDILRSLECFKNSKMFYDWINEVPESKILEKYGIEPGILRYKVEQAKWILYANKEIYALLDIEEKCLSDTLNELVIRIEYGASRELIELLKIKHIGRNRARLLYNSGIKNGEDILNNHERVIKLLGNKITDKIINCIKENKK